MWVKGLKLPTKWKQGLNPLQVVERLSSPHPDINGGSDAQKGFISMDVVRHLRCWGEKGSKRTLTRGSCNGGSEQPSMKHMFQSFRTLRSINVPCFHCWSQRRPPPPETCAHSSVSTRPAMMQLPKWETLALQSLSNLFLTLGPLWDLRIIQMAGIH